MPSVSREEFELMVGDALDLIPQHLLDSMDNVIIQVVDEPPDGRHILGLYEGTPLTERGEGWHFTVPDVISIYQGPLQRRSVNMADLRHEINVTVIHEVAHHFGIDDDRLDELGWG